MAIVGLVLVGGTWLALRWSGVPYRRWSPGADASTTKRAALGLMNAVVVAFIGGFWAGLLVTGPAIRLVMRLLAITAGDDAQGRITEAEEVVGEISVDGTMALILFGGVVTGLVSAVLYVLVRRWLPAGRWAGPAFGLILFALFATRLDPLRPGNRDFDLVGPGWLAVAAFGLTSVVHGTAVVAFTAQASTRFPEVLRTRRPRLALAAGAPPVALAAFAPIIGIPTVVAIALAIAFAHLGLRAEHLERPVVLRTGWLVMIALVVLATPGTVMAIADIVDR